MGISRLCRPEFLGAGSVGLFGLSQFLIIALYPALAHATGLSLADVLFSFTLGSLGILWSGPFLASKSDSWGRGRTLSIALLGLALSNAYLVYLIMKGTEESSLLALTLGRLLYGMTAGAIPSVAQAWWRDQHGRVTDHMLSHSLALNCGRLLAPLFIIFLSGSLATILLLVAILAATLSALTWTSHSSVVAQRTQKREASHGMLILLVFSVTAYIGVIHSVLAHELQRGFSLSETPTSLLTAKALLLSGVIVVSLQALLRKLKRGNGGSLLFISLTSFFLSSFYLVSMNEMADLISFTALFSLGLACVTPGYLSFSQSGGKAAGMIGAIQTLGLCAGSALSSLLFKNFFSLEFLLLALWGSMFLSTAKLMLGRRIYA